jgi:glutaredoxin 3
VPGAEPSAGEAEPSAQGAASGAAEAPEAREEQPAAPPTEREVMAAMRRVPITLYTTPWCPVCTKARRWLKYNNIPFVEHDIEANPAGKRAMRDLNPRGSVPTIHLDGEVLVGWNEREVSRLITQGVERRLRETR